LIAIRIDPAVLAAVRQEAKRRRLGYQSLINAVLAKHVERMRSA
jgi:predicted DNA binding CopG/RHH family protein